MYKPNQPGADAAISQDVFLCKLCPRTLAALAAWRTRRALRKISTAVRVSDAAENCKRSRSNLVLQAEQFRQNRGT